ncbi:MAG: HlyD family efflux transporter periplasmic adaptor subunit [Xanthomonadales bacterium]|nr:HlyD family efflux transporter periplasmic adaptor subunit [Xanthomonadales bacterium]
MNTPQSSALLLALGALLLTACDREPETFMVGTLERNRIELKVESNEPIVAIHVRDGQAVVPGDPVLSQDPARAQDRLAQVSSQRDQAAARLAELKRGPREETIREARANLEVARAQRVNALADLERTRGVYERGLSSKGQLDRDETAYKTAIAREQAALEGLERLLNGTTVEELQQAEAALEATQAQVRAAELDLARTHIIAPVAGTVDKVLYQLGERPPPGTTIAVLLDSSRSFARVYVPENLRYAVQPGETLNVRVDGVAEPLQGRVRWVSADASFTPYFALTEHDRSRLSYLAEIDLEGSADLPSGVPLQADFPAGD